MLTVKQHFKNLILEGNIKEALSEMMQKTEESGQKNLNEELLLLSARFNRNETQKRQGVIEDGDYNISVNRITHTLNEYVEQFRGGDMPYRDEKRAPPVPNPVPPVEIPDRFVPLPARQLAKINYEEKPFRALTQYIDKGLVLLVTATETETATLHQKMEPFPGEEGLLQVQRKSSTYYLGNFGNFAVAHVECTDMGALASGGATLTIDNAIDALHPKFVLMVGIAFGVDENSQNIGDVLVSHHIISYESQKIAENKVIHRGSKESASVNLRNSFKNIKSWQYILPNQAQASIELCDILSGEKLIDNREVRDQLVDQFPTAKGGEMEGAGLYAACKNNRVEWILVKSICDFADGKKSEGKKAKQELAIDTAVDACFHLFNKKYVFESLEIYAYE